jgi:hypothetical protein
VVAANFRPNSGVTGQVGIPQARGAAAGLAATVTVSLVLDRRGPAKLAVAEQTSQSLTDNGFPVSVPNQTAHVYGIE